jgi:NAD+ kinase
MSLPRVVPDVDIVRFATNDYNYAAMMEKQPILNNILVLAHPNLPEAFSEATELASILKENGLRADHGSLYDEGLRTQAEAGEYELLIALGGDGTILRAGHLGGPCDIPILGINLGHFGFLTEIDQTQWRSMLPRLLRGDYWLERRMMLCTEQWRAGQRLGSWDVVNEVVVSRGSIMRPVHLITSVDGRYLTTYVADGLIASTATGSTAYALAAGGPILPPELRNILIVPVAPHLSVERAIVLAEGSSVSITVKTDHQAAFSVDGQIPVEMEDGDRVDAYVGEHTVKMVRFQDPGYFYRNLTSHMNRNPSAGTYR